MCCFTCPNYINMLNRLPTSKLAGSYRFLSRLILGFRFSTPIAAHTWLYVYEIVIIERNRGSTCTTTNVGFPTGTIKKRPKYFSWCNSNGCFISLWNFVNFSINYLSSFIETHLKYIREIFFEDALYIESADTLLNCYITGNFYILNTSGSTWQLIYL